MVTIVFRVATSVNGRTYTCTCLTQAVIMKKLKFKFSYFMAPCVKGSSYFLFACWDISELILYH